MARPNIFLGNEKAKQIKELRGNKKHEKRKSKKVKEPAVAGNSRMLSRYGKEQKKGQSGEAAWYVTRKDALKRLQLAEEDFRRLCILKGIYPTMPVKNGKISSRIDSQTETFYHVKDLKFLMHEPLLQKYRDLKTLLAKVNGAVQKKEISEAKRMYDNRPMITLDHLVRERYPRFTDSLEDLDDCLTLLGLFASLPKPSPSKKSGAEKAIEDISWELIATCERLMKEWNFFVIKAKCLKKAFVSVKGVYYQAELVEGINATWLVPFRFAQNYLDENLVDKESKEIDFKIMKTFVEFYITLMGFVLFKLYHDIGYKYPPSLDEKKDEDGEILGAIKPQKLNNENIFPDKQDNRMDINNDSAIPNDNKTVVVKNNKKITEIVRVIAENSGRKAGEGEDEIESEHSEVESDEDDFGDVNQDETRNEIIASDKQQKKFKTMFKNLCFYVSREVPFEPIEFCLKSFEGHVILPFQSELSESDLLKITHVISDRDVANCRDPIIQSLYATKSAEFIQPQWVFDSINAHISLPVEKYRTEVDVLPPHLSPFVDDRNEGYVPAYRDELDRLIENNRLANANGNVAEEYRKINLLADGNENNQRSAVVDVDENESLEEDTESEEEEDNDDVQIHKTDPEEEEEEEEEGSDDKSEDDYQAEAVAVEVKQPLTKKQKATIESPKAVVKKEKQAVIEFIKAPKFAGSKEGFIYKNGKNGLGYYKDSYPQSNVQFETKARMSNRERRRQEQKDMKGMGQVVMKKGAKRLYDKLKGEHQDKQDKVDNLKRKRDALDSSNKNRTSSKGGKNFKKGKK